MSWKSPEDAKPWVGLYVFVASLVCTLAMAADAFQGFRQWKLWFPCRFFTINAASITLIAIAMKLPVDLTSSDLKVKFVGIIFLITMLANFLHSLGVMNDRELLMNMLAFGILLITITVNVFIQFNTASKMFLTPIYMISLVTTLPWLFSVALSVPAFRRNLENRYNEMNIFALNCQEINFSSKELMHYVKKYWMMAETGNPQFVISCSPVSSAFGLICIPLVGTAIALAIPIFHEGIPKHEYYHSEYKWSIILITAVQLIGIVIGSIAPICRCLTSVSYFSLSKKWSKDHINAFRVEKHWIQKLHHWKRSHVHSRIPGRHCKNAFHISKNMILNLCIALQMTVVVTCKTICLVPISLLILLSYIWYFFKSRLKSFKEEPSEYNSNIAGSEMEEYTTYCLQIEEETELSKRILRNTLKSITRLLHESEKREPNKLINLLEKSPGFSGVLEFDNNQIPPLHSEETHNSWSLVVVTLTVVAIALPNIANRDVKGLLASMREGLQIVTCIEEIVNENGDFVEPIKAGRRLWTEVELHRTWLKVGFQKNYHKSKTSKEILQWLGDEAVKFVLQFKKSKSGSLDHSLCKFMVANCMYRISQTILLHCSVQENWPNDAEIYEWISIIIADVLCACFTNLPHVITKMCHQNAIEKKEDNIRTAAQLLGKSQKILKMLKARRLPNLDMDSMAYIDKWQAL